MTMIFPDFAFGHDHRDYFSEAIAKQGGSIAGLIAIPPTETSFTQYFAQIPADTEVIYHVMVGPGVLTFVKEMGEHFGSTRPQVFGFIDSLEAVDFASPGLEFLEGTYFWEADPRYAQANQTSTTSPIAPRSASTMRALRPKTRRTSRPIPTCSAAGRRSTSSRRRWKKRLSGRRTEAGADRGGRSHDRLRRKAPSIRKATRSSTARSIRHSAIRTSRRWKARSWTSSHRTSIEDGFYEPEADYTKMAL